METDTTSELGEEEPTTDENYRDGWDSVATRVGDFDANGVPTFNIATEESEVATEAAMNARPSKTLSDDR